MNDRDLNSKLDGQALLSGLKFALSIAKREPLSGMIDMQVIPDITRTTDNDLLQYV